MSNTNGWGLSARLITKHFGVIGDKIAGAIASFDPETATEADRDNLAEKLRDAAQLLAKGRIEYNKEHDDVIKLQNLILNDEKAFDTLAARLEAGTISEATVNLFCDELESNKARLEVEISEEVQAKEYLDEVQKIVDALSQQLQEFEQHAKKAILELNRAKAQKELQEMRVDRQAELSSLTNIKTQSSSLSALMRKSQAINSEAEGLKILANIQQKPLDEQAEIDSIRKSISNSAVGETTAERLKRLANKTTSAA